MWLEYCRAGCICTIHACVHTWSHKYIHHLIIISSIVSHCRENASPRWYHLLLSCAVLIHVMPANFTISSLHQVFLSSLTPRTCHWSPFCCYLCPPVVLSSGKVSRPSKFLEFNFFYDILDFSLLSDPFASFSISLGNSKHTSFHVSLCCSKFLFQFFVIAQVSAP